MGRRRGLFGRLLAIAASGVALVTVPAASAATTRYAAPAGSGTACSQVAPCDIATAINGAVSGDVVAVASGTYGSAGSPITQTLTAAAGVTVEGVATGPGRPVIYSSAAPAMSLSGGASDLDLEQVGSLAEGLDLGTAATATRMYVRTVASDLADTCSVTGLNVVVTDSLCWEGDPSFHSAFIVQSGSATVRNDTIVGANDGLYDNGGSIEAINCILLGPNSKDVSTNAGSVTLTTDEYATTGGTPPTSTGQISAAPVFDDAANGDFHEGTNAPSINAGLDNAANGTNDLDGDLRELGAHTDLGAYEVVPSGPSATTTAATSRGFHGATLTGSLNGAGAPTSYHFIYGTSAGSLTSSTATQTAPAASGSQAVSVPVTGLAIGTKYFYELVAATSVSTATGSASEQSFSTYRAAPPSIAFAAPADGAVYRLGKTLHASYRCTDNSGGSGIASCVGSVASGSPIKLSKLGSHSFTVRASDNAGNVFSRTVHYRVIRPSNKFTVTHVKTFANGAITFDIKVPGPGSLQVLESASTNNVGRKPARFRFTVARVHKNARRAGKLQIRVVPSKHGKLLVSRHRHGIVLRLRVTYRPKLGVARSKDFRGLRLPR
jgi:hypothetical protein